MSASNRYMNWSGASFTPSPSGTAVAIDGIINCEINRDGEVVRFKGDLAVFTQLLAMPAQNRVITLTVLNIGKLQTIPLGSRGSIVVNLADAVNGVTTGGGGLLFTLGTCLVVNNDAAGAHAKEGTGTISFEGYASDGATDPLVVTAL